MTMTENTTNNQELKDLYERYASLVHRRCKYILHSEDDAWDATQEVFIKLMASLNSIRNRGSVYSWLLSTSTNLCISMLRKKTGEEFDETVHAGENNPSKMSAEKRVIFKEIITKLFKPWDKKIRDVVIYSYIDDYSQKEISALTGLGESTIRKYLLRFKRGVQYAYSDAKEVIDA
jgi:RNA polymerase sigma-70 factor, ECF subfamily